MHEFSRKFLTEWRKLNLPFSAQTIVAAISGGADSTALLLVLQDLRNRKKLSSRIIIAHYNHNLRGPDSEQDARFVQTLAENYNLEFTLGIGQISSRGNVEQNARTERYQFLSETAENLQASIILTAHTINDQAESVLLNLIRGSGLEGLTGIKQKRRIENESEILLVRPFLNWAKRSDTENFCLENKIEFRHDAMNEDLTFKRVRVRKILLPLLKELNPKIIDTLAKTARLLRQDFEALQSLAERNCQSPESFDSEKSSANSPEKHLLISDLTEIFPSIRRYILRDWLKNERGDLRQLTTKHFEAIEQLIISRKSGKTIQLPGGAIIVKGNGKLVFKKNV